MLMQCACLLHFYCTCFITHILHVLKVHNMLSIEFYQLRMSVTSFLQPQMLQVYQLVMMIRRWDSADLGKESLEDYSTRETAQPQFNSLVVSLFESLHHLWNIIWTFIVGSFEILLELVHLRLLDIIWFSKVLQVLMLMIFQLCRCSRYVMNVKAFRSI